MVESTTYSDDSVSWAMAGTPWILCSVWWVRCGAEPVLVYRRQPGMSIVRSPVLPRFFIFPRRQPLTTLVRLSFILRDSPGPDKKRSLNSEVSWHLKAKHFANITYIKINYSMFTTTSSLRFFYISRGMGKSPWAIWWHQPHLNSVTEFLSDLIKSKQMEGRKWRLIIERMLCSQGSLSALQCVEKSHTAWEILIILHMSKSRLMKSRFGKCHSQDLNYRSLTGEVVL